MSNTLTSVEIEERFNDLPTLEHYQAIKKAEDSLLKIFYEFAKAHLTDDHEFAKEYCDAFHEISDAMRNDPSDCIAMHEVLQLLCARIPHRTIKG
jgi:hypothetical protein